MIMISYSDALEIIENKFRQLELKTEKIPLTVASGKILAEDVISDIDLPLFNNSAMDGYAVVFSPDISEWEIIGSISAGNYKNILSGEKKAIEIMTGSKIPSDFDTVIPVEDVESDGANIKLKKSIPFRKGLNIRKTGEDISAGEMLVRKNTLLSSKEIAALASVGKTQVLVYSPLKAGILTTGDELIDIHETPVNDQIRATNLYALLAAAGEIKMEALNFGIIKDDYKATKNKIATMLLSDIDILITTGGVSAGKYDYIKNIFEEEGIEIHFHKVNIKPGKPVLFGTHGSGKNLKLIFGLPGNPVSALVAFIIFIKKAVLSLYGIKQHNEITAVLAGDIKKNDSKLHFVRGNLRKENEVYNVYPADSQSSGNIAQMAAADCLIMINEDVANPCKGDRLNCIMI